MSSHGRRFAESDMAARVIVIAPVGIGVRIVAHRKEYELVTFESVREFEEWRGGRDRRCTIGADVDLALDAAGVDRHRLHKTLSLLSALRRQRCTPHLKQLVAVSGSARTFYRAWAEEIAQERPSVFLERVRAIHARRLISHGRLPETVWREAGYRSSAHMQAALKKWQ